MTGPTISHGSPTAVEQLHESQEPVSDRRLSPIGRSQTVMCIHVKTLELVECDFVEGSGAWIENSDGAYAVGGQHITRDGEPGGDYVVAAPINEDGTVACAEPRLARDAEGIPAGNELAQMAVVEKTLSASNVTGLRLRHFTTLEVCTSSFPHPDGAVALGNPSPGVYCYKGVGAALNVRDGKERDERGVRYPGKEYSHVLWISGFEVPGSKRPNTIPFPAPGRVNPRSPIVWRPAVNIAIGNPLFP